MDNEHPRGFGHKNTHPPGHGPECGRARKGER